MFSLAEEMPPKESEDTIRVRQNTRLVGATQSLRASYLASENAADKKIIQPSANGVVHAMC